APSYSHPNLSVVGDDSQSIYKFRGAAISNILSFMKEYPESKQVILTTSYRCSQTILDAAYKLIKHNNPHTLESQLGISKNLKAGQNSAQRDQNPNGEKIELFHSERVEDEAEKIVNFIRQYKSDFKKDFKDFAILVRANNHSQSFIRTLERAKIPYQFLGPGMLFQRPEVKELIAYLKVLADFTDSTSLYRVLSMDLWQIDIRDLIAVLNVAKKANHSLFEQMEQIIEKPINISSDSKAKLKSLVDLVHRQQKLIKKETAGQILYYFLLDSGLLKQIVDYKTQAEERRALNITKFFDRLKSYEATHEDASVFAVVDYLDLAMNMGESPLAAEIDWTENDAVNILTVHSAKGLEFPIVILTNLVEGRFPSRERNEQIPIPVELIREILPTGDYHLQEERRLFYVGMTRAEEKLIFSASNYYGEGKRERKLSPFISESLGIDKQAQKQPYLQNSQIPLFEWKKTPDHWVEEAKTQPLSKLKLDYLSYSAIEAFRICPLHFKLRYILRLPTAPTAAQSLGNSVHYALRDFYTVQRSGKNEKKLLLSLLDTNWVGYGYTSKKHEQQAKELAKLFLQNYLKTLLHQTARPLYLERAFNFRVDPSLKILGKIDRIDDLGDGNIEIIDYKTGTNVPNQNRLNTDLQMTIYALAAVNPGILGKRVDQVKMSFYFFANAKKISTVRSKEQLNDAINQLLKAREEIEKSDFKCSRGIICRNCEYKILCNE
ncbi:ATP-dependent helicase, partial [Candidatus Roizmanbacteria bacterium]|nr:ATP-dependent helicase [Candidatus Roizmanbacteria bacterium]